MSWTKQSSNSSGGTTTSKWEGKTWNVIGDSITEVNFRTNMHYHDYISQELNMTVNNYGISGTGYFTPSTSGGTNAIYQRISALSSTADLVTIFAGTNDWGQVGKTLVMGSYGDTNGANSFYGAVDSTLSQLISKYPTNTQIAVFTPCVRTNSAMGDAVNSSGIAMNDVADAIIRVCKKYSVPCLDLWRNSAPLAPWNTTNNNTYFKDPRGDTADGLHPNDAGHKILADKILAFLNSL